MSVRMHSMLGWIRRQLGNFGATPVKARKRPARVPSIYDSLERRQVLSTATLSPFVALPGLVTPSSVTTTATNTASTTTTFYPQATATIATLQAPALTPVVASSVQPTVVVPTVSIAAVSSEASYVQSLYHDVLGRSGSANEVAAWVGEINSGATPQVVAASFVNSIEHRQDEVDAFYEKFLGRAPEPGSAAWVDALLSGASEEEVAEGILDSPEYQATHADSTSFIQGLYLDVLDRQGDQTDVAAWDEALASGVSRQAVVASFVNSPEAVDRVVDGYYSAFLGRAPEVGTSNPWTVMLESPNGSATDVAIGILSSVEYLQDSQQG